MLEKMLDLIRAEKCWSFEDGATAALIFEPVCIDRSRNAGEVRRQDFVDW
jgi:hypothetical protein